MKIIFLYYKAYLSSHLFARSRFLFVRLKNALRMNGVHNKPGNKIENLSTKLDLVVSEQINFVKVKGNPTVSNRVF